MPEQRDSSASYSKIVGDLYARWTLDCLVEVAYAVSKDFIARPEFYKGGAVPDGIVDLRMEYGTSTRFPNQAQRQEINFPILGSSDGYQADSTDKFRSLRKPLFDSCVTYSERTIADAGASLEQGVRSALQLFQPYLRNFDGNSIRESDKQIKSVSDAAYELLRSTGVSQVFGVTPPPPAEWPIDSNDSSGALLVRAIGEKLQLPAQQMFNEEKFQRLRRVAQQGRDALQAILDFEPAKSDNLDVLIGTIYTWAISLKDYWGH